jgi:hypothetical protein
MIEREMELAEEQEKELVERLIRILDDPKSTPEEVEEAQDQMEELAEDATVWIKPVGYRLLVYVPYLGAKLESLAMPESSRAVYQTALLDAYVLAVGPEAYQDRERYPNGSWCNPGDHIIMRAYSGTRFIRSGHKLIYALINDDTVEGVIKKGIVVERPT